MADDVATDLAAWCAAAVSLLRHAPDELDGPEAAWVHRELRAVCDRVLAFAARLLPRVEADGRWAVGGARSFPEWVAGQRGSSVGAARGEVVLGRALGGELPVAAVTSGRMTLEHAQVLARLAPTSQARWAALASDLADRNEAALVAKAERLGVDEYRRAVKRWAAAVDGAAHEREHQGACAAERLVMAPRDGGVAFEGFLTVEHGDALMTALRAVGGVPAAGDDRTPDQRRAHALVDLARLVLDRGLAGGGAQVRPHVSVHVPWETYLRLANDAGSTGGSEVGAESGSEGGAGAAHDALRAPAELDDGEPLAPSVLARIACDSDVTRIVFGPESQPLDVGRAQRTFTGPQRRAVIARDRHCRYPGCTRPPVLGEVHHVRWWARDGGSTSTGNGILVCWYHHDLIHQRDLRIDWVKKRWEFRRPDGTVMRAPGAPPVAPPGGSAGGGLGAPLGGAPGAAPPGSAGTGGVEQGQLALAG